MVYHLGPLDGAEENLDQDLTISSSDEVMSHVAQNACRLMLFDFAAGVFEDNFTDRFINHPDEIQDNLRPFRKLTKKRFWDAMEVNIMLAPT